MKLTKKKRLEKAKVKLKAKKLPKGQNVTDTSFKVRKIIIPGQLKSLNDQEIRTKSQHSLQELLAHLNHYKVPMRRDGLSGLKELALSYEEEIFNLYLPKVIDGVTNMILDEETEIRKSALGLLEIILTKAASMQIEPHFHVLQTYMMCAMTHINSSIRLDSLQLLDILLKECPKLMVDKANDVMPTFLDLISSSKNAIDPSRVISVNLFKKITDMQWRLRVLSRLTKYFSAIVSFGEKKFSKGTISRPNVEKPTNVIKWDGKSPVYIGDHIQEEMEVCYLPSIFEPSDSEIDCQSNTTANKEMMLKKHIEGLMPILFDSWVEVCPRQGDKINILSHEAAMMLHCILEIILSLWDSLENWQNVTYEKDSLAQWFTDQYRKNIISTFLSGFPYVLQDNVFSPKGKKSQRLLTDEEKSLFGNTDLLTSKCIQQNLKLCFLLTCLDNGRDSNIAKRVVECVQICVNEWVSLESLPTLEKILKVILISQSKYWPKDKIVQSIIEKCQKKSTDEGCRHLLFSFLCDFLLSPNCSVNLRCKAFDKWVSDLPNLLLQPEIPMKIVMVLRVLASQDHKFFMVNLKKRRRNIMDFLCKIRISGVPDQLEGQKAIIEILFQIADHQMFEYLCSRIKEKGGNAELLAYVENLKELHIYLFSNSIQQ